MFHLFNNGIEEVIVRLSDNGVVEGIPRDTENTDYQAFLKWLEQGNTPEEYNPPA